MLQIGAFRIDRTNRRMMRGDTPVHIQQMPLDVLLYLAAHPSRLISREELLNQFWPRAVNDESLTRCISTIRKLLGDVREPPQYIETLWGRGYRLIAEVGKAGVTTDSSIERIAVLPISARDDVEWAAAALTDQLISTVAKIEGIAVLGRGSVSSFSATSDPMEIGRRLKVDAVLQSDWSRSGEYAGLRSVLVSTRDGSVLWTYQVDALQTASDEETIRELAAAIAARLWARLQLRTTDEPVDPAAHRHYLRGRYFWNQRSSTSLSAAIESFNAALDLDPDYVDALVGLADTWLLLPLYSAVAPHEAITRSRGAAEQALRLHPSESHAHAVIGVIGMQYDWDWVAAESRLLKAVALNPNDTTAIQWLGDLYGYQARFEECRRQYRLALGLDPLSPIVRMMQGSPLLYAGRFQEAITVYKQALQEMPDFNFTRYVIGLAYAGLGAWPQAIACYESSLVELGLEIVGGPLIFALAQSGDTDGAHCLLTKLQALALRRYVPPLKLATAYLGLGDRRRALDWLVRALESHDDRLVYLGVDAHFSSLHADPRFRDIAAQVGIVEVLDPL